MRERTLGGFVVEIPSNPLERLRGLLGRKGLAPGRGMLFERTRSVRTFGMRFPILVVFLDRGYEVIETRIARPGRLIGNRRARHVAELAIGSPVSVGQRLELTEGPPRSIGT